MPDWLAARLGIGQLQLAEVIKGGSLDAPIADAKFHNIDRRDNAAEFALEWALKDVDLALGTAGGGEECGQEGLPGADHGFWCAFDGGIRRSLKRTKRGYTRRPPEQTRCAAQRALVEIGSRIGTTASRDAVIELEQGQISRSW